LQQIVLQEFGSPWVRVRVAKLAPVPGVKELGVEIERSRPA
jgi:dihydroneopterin aldolase